MLVATQADYGWDLPDMSDAADNNAAFTSFANGVANTLKGVQSSTLSTYIPTWKTFTIGTATLSPAQPGVYPNPSGPGSVQGFYRVQNKTCFVFVDITFSATTNAGSGIISVSLPVMPNQAVRQQRLNCHLWTGVLWNGPGLIDVNYGANFIPWFPVSSARCEMAQWASTGGGGGGPIPQISPFSVVPGGAFTAQGWYFTA